MNAEARRRGVVVVRRGTGHGCPSTSRTESSAPPRLRVPLLGKFADAAFAEGDFGGAGLEVVRGKGETGCLVVAGAAEERGAQLGDSPGCRGAWFVCGREAVRPGARSQHDGTRGQPGGEILRAQDGLRTDQLAVPDR